MSGISVWLFHDVHGLFLQDENENLRKQTEEFHDEMKSLRIELLDDIKSVKVVISWDEVATLNLGILPFDIP